MLFPFMRERYSEDHGDYEQLAAYDRRARRVVRQYTEQIEHLVAPFQTVPPDEITHVGGTIILCRNAVSTSLTTDQAPIRGYGSGDVTLVAGNRQRDDAGPRLHALILGLHTDWATLPHVSRLASRYPEQLRYVATTFHFGSDGWYRKTIMYPPYDTPSRDEQANWLATAKTTREAPVTVADFELIDTAIKAIQDRVSGGKRGERA